MTSTILDICKKTKEKIQILVLVTGVFDVLHEEHRYFLDKAKEIGDVLVVGLESDIRVKQIKGENRLLNLQKKRVRNLESWKIADCVFVLPEKFKSSEDHLELLKKIVPDILAVSEHSLHLGKKQQLMKKIGGKVVIVHDHNPAVSTTQILTV